MRLRSAKSPAPCSWHIFPAEIRIMILNDVAGQDNTDWSSLATVCREWQCHMEQYNFRKLVIPSSSTHSLQTIVPAESRRRLAVRHICLNIELPRYSLECCDQEGEAYYRPSELVERAIKTLFSTLSKWKHHDSLTLELNAYSPSDTEHWFPNIHLYSDTTEDTVRPIRRPGF